MKKSFKTIFSVLALLAVAAACKKENPAQETVIPASDLLITIKVTAPGEINKVSLTQDPNDADGAVLLAWAANDAITVTGTAGAKEFAIKPAFVGQATAEFVGEDPGAGPYTIAYNKDGSLTQAADGSTNHLGYGVAITSADSYADVQFNPTWASQHSGSLEQSAVLRLRAKLPSDVAASVTAVHFEASESIFNGGKTLSVPFTTAGDAGNDGIINVYATLAAGSSNVTIPAGTELLIQFQTSDKSYNVYTAYYKYAAADAIHPGSVYPIKINRPNIKSFASESGLGTAASPYLIGDQHQMQAIDDLMEAGATKYFKLIDDIDMTDMAWTRLNNKDANFSALIDFDGNNKTVSNLKETMFYVFKGSIKNLTLDNPTVTAVSQRATFASYIQGTGNTITNVDIRNVASFPTGGTNCGGMVGRINSGTDGVVTATFTDCDITDVNVEVGSSTTGGFIGSVEAKVVMENCTRTGGNVSGTDKDNVGGFVGKASADLNLTDCSVSKSGDTGSVSGANSVGGLVGYYTGGEIRRCHTDVAVTGTGHYLAGLIGDMHGGEIHNSYATGAVTQTGTGSAAYYVGGFIGRTNAAVTIEDCHSSGTVTHTTHYAGAFIGKHDSGTLTLNRCYSTGNVVISAANAAANLGSLLGHVTADVSISNCYSSGAIKSVEGQNYVRRWCGGIIGTTGSGAKISITNSYTTSTFTTYASPNGALIGNNGAAAADVTCTGCIGWSTLSGFNGAGNAISVGINNYLGTEGSVYSQAVALGGWDFTNVWTTDASPQLRPYVAQ